MSVKYTEELRPTLQCKTFPLSSLDKYKYVVICSYYEGKYMLSRHSKRTTWETQGGHIEAGETLMEAAKRELYEESGVTDAEIIPVCDYNAWCDAGDANGVVFAAVIKAQGNCRKVKWQRLSSLINFQMSLHIRWLLRFCLKRRLRRQGSSTI